MTDVTRSIVHSHKLALHLRLLIAIRDARSYFQCLILEEMTSEEIRTMLVTRESKSKLVSCEGKITSNRIQSHDHPAASSSRISTSRDHCKKGISSLQKQNRQFRRSHSKAKIRVSKRDNMKQQREQPRDP